MTGLEASPLAGDESKNIGLEASCDARVWRGVALALCASVEGPAAGLLGAWELRVLRLGVAAFRLDRRGEDILS